MGQTVIIPVQEHAMWPQGDARDPLGVWAARDIITGNADTPVFIQALITIPAALRRAHVYTCYSLFSGWAGGPNPSSETGVIGRLVTNWPNADPEEGVQGFSTSRRSTVTIQVASVFPDRVPDNPLITPEMRFILLMDPSAVGSGNDMTIAEIQRDSNVLNTLYAFEAYGYYWDQAVLDTPGGPRHPGSR
ncbi:MAG: hypothetical protein V3S55_13655 [Nitrospiraceae bacterium]